MHHGTVPETLDVFINALRQVTPGDLANSVARHEPIAETGEVLPESLKILCGREVDERITMVQLRLKIHGQIQKIVRSKKTLLVEKLQKVRACVRTRDIPHHRRCAPLIADLSISVAFVGFADVSTGASSTSTRCLARDVHVCSCLPIQNPKLLNE